MTHQCETLTEMLGPPPFEAMRRYDPKWTYPLLIPANLSLKMLNVKEKILEVALKYAWAVQSKRRLKALIKGMHALRAMPRNLARGLLEITGTMCEINEEQETVNMCNAVQELINDGIKKARKKEREDGFRQGRIDGLKKGIEQGRIDGLKEGIEQGRIDGLKEGIEQGKIDGRNEEREQNARNFAAYLQSQSMPVRRVRSTLRKWFRLATKDLDKICPLL